MKTLVIDAICGVGFPTLSIALTAERAHLAHYVGGQNNARHEWRREKLQELDQETLQMMYEGLRTERDGSDETPAAASTETLISQSLGVAYAH